MLNSLKLKKLNPSDVVKNARNYNLFAEKALKKMQYAMQHAVLPQTYESLNPQNQVLANGVFFNNLLNTYLSVLNVDFKDLRLQTKTAFTNRPVISAKEYNKLPKIYRGIFMQYDYDNYVLRSNDDPYIVLSIKKGHKAEAKSLLEYARILIPTIYKTKWRENAPELTKAQHDKKWLDRTISEHFIKPDFTEKNSLRAHFVSDMQIDTIQKLRDVFAKLGDITLLHQRYNICYETAPHEYVYRPGAWYLYNEYKNELTQSNRYLNAQQAINTSNGKGIQTLIEASAPENRSGLQTLAEHAKCIHENARQRIVAKMQMRIK